MLACATRGGLGPRATHAIKIIMVCRAINVKIAKKVTAGMELAAMELAIVIKAGRLKIKPVCVRSAIRDFTDCLAKSVSIATMEPVPTVYCMMAIASAMKGGKTTSLSLVRLAAWKFTPVPTIRVKNSLRFVWVGIPGMGVVTTNIVGGSTEGLPVFAIRDLVIG